MAVLAVLDNTDKWRLQNINYKNTFFNATKTYDCYIKAY